MLLLVNLLGALASKERRQPGFSFLPKRVKPVQHRVQLQTLQEAANKYTKLEHIPDTFVGDLQCSYSVASNRKGKVLVKGDHHKRGEAEHCRQACRYAAADFCDTLAEGHRAMGAQAQCICYQAMAQLTMPGKYAPKQWSRQSLLWACRDHADCSHWFWCDDPSKCMDLQGDMLPQHACQLKWEPRHPWGVPPNNTILARASTYASGFVKRAPPPGVMCSTICDICNLCPAVLYACTMA